MNYFKNKAIVGLFIILPLIACGGGRNDSTTVTPIQPPSPEPIPAPVNNIVEINFSFNTGLNGWRAGFSDYSIGSDGLLLASGFEQLPIPLDNLSGFSVSGVNRVDDLYMFIKRSYSGFLQNTAYQIQFETTFATNASGATNCLGVGGAPGTAVTIKAGAVNFEPLSVLSAGNKYRMNIDKGVQKNSGSNAIAIGHFGNTKECGDTTYEEKTLTNDPAKSFTVRTGENGILWFLFSSDSGFESITHIYYLRGKITASKL